MAILYDNCLQISISDLKRWGYLKRGEGKSGTITWSVGEGESKEITAQIGITMSIYSENSRMILNYTCNGNPINYRVDLENVPSNLGKGIVWFFVCPHTGKGCRKLYLVGERFLHRKAFTGCMYKTQTRSNRWSLWDTIFECEDAEEKINSRYFKKYYNGKPTKRYTQLLKITEQTVNPLEFEKLLR